jgi:quercetin dioxygenase-like cupin family protein
VALFSFVSSAEESVAVKPAFTDHEIRIILSHGPWPAPVPNDPSNRVSGKLPAIEFGTRLFFDQRLSGSGTTACASCHVPERNWTDNLRRGIGVAEVDRNTPTLMNLRGQRWYGWDGAADSLWSQSLRPILDARELAATPRHVAALVRSDEQLSCRYRRVFGVPPSATDDEAVFVDQRQVEEGEQKHFEQAIPNIPGKSLVAFVVDYAPGGASPSHTHAKSAFIFAYVVPGEIESQVNDGPKRVYRAGESFFETPGSSHPVSRNASKTEPAKLLAIFVVDSDDKELTTPVK